MLWQGKKAQRTQPRNVTQIGQDDLRTIISAYVQSNDEEGYVDIINDVGGENNDDWLYCDCQGPVAGLRGFPPAFTTRTNNKLVRLAAPWGAHATECPFYIKPSEHRAGKKSHRKPSETQKVKLTGPFGVEIDSNVRAQAPQQGGGVQRRNSLAEVLMRLIDTSYSNWLSLDDQHQDDNATSDDALSRLWRAGKKIPLEGRGHLSEILFTNLDWLPQRLEKIKERNESWEKGPRPFQILITLADEIAPHAFRALNGQKYEVQNHLAVFGEPLTQEDRVAATRAPWVVICLLASNTQENDPAILRAYAHPVYSTTRLMPVDSNYERITLTVIVDALSRLTDHENYHVIKPVFDADKAPADAPGPVIPDFIVTRKRDEDAGKLRRAGTRLLVETMGYNDPMYRERKNLMHELMKIAFRVQEVVTHDFTLNEDRDDIFVRNLLEALGE
ncbi:hypothetical protein [Gluconobacter kondonii]|uniref:DUF1173 domain-containing protein n=1 Tax=Gluconobacter kondonii TaxID=941463 RepID=A0ABQ5WXL2_9PROT|nr:hypothetical protein [Gluconobacter kondonii]GBR36696.1 hypothetical protein AA3266_2447 [Gluconobacter kondonii NBRC 3266]GLQ67381.1 hypothetical protein GCM10007870_29660 [Gluconobacter kondonii]